ncbi:Sec1-like protein [Mycena floridula]|nr:Sec1-like protein [Mycena floridula]
MTADVSSTENTDLDTSLLTEIGRKTLVDALNSVNGAKTLVLDSSLAGPLGLITEVSLLKHHGVDKMFWLEPGPLTSTTSNIVYLCRPLIRYIKIIADQIKRHAKESQQHTYTLLLVPRVSTLVSRILEEEGVLGEVTISSYNLQFIPIADDVISLENDSAFKELWVDGDETVIYNSAQALITLQKLYGLFPRILGKGDHAARLAALLTSNLPKSTDSSVPDSLLEPSSTLDSLVIIDRKVDMITPLLTQLTYQGLIDELLGIKNSHVELPASLLSPPAPESSNPAAPAPSTSATASLKKEVKKKYLLANSDTLFVELRDLNFSVVGKRLNKVARRIEEEYKTSLQAKTIPQLRDVVGKLGGLKNEHQTLRIHTGLSELLVPMIHTEIFNKTLEIQQNLLASYNVNEQLVAIEDLIALGADMPTVLRLTCLASITGGGIKTKALESIKREILQAYGYNFLPLLLSLSAPLLGILLPNPLPASTVSAKYPYATLRKSLRLFADDSPDGAEEVENDITFAYSGYAPISVRLVQCIAQKGGVLSNPFEKEKGTDKSDKESSPVQVQAHPIVGWKGFEDVLATIPGETVDVFQNGLNVLQPAQPRHKETTTVLFFLGGCTYTEIAALRWVSRQHRGRKFLIATTGIITGSSIIDGIAGIATTARSKDAGI